MLPGRFEFERVTRANDWIDLVRNLPGSSPLLRDHRRCPPLCTLSKTDQRPRLRPATIKGVGLLLATYARPDGTNAWPGIERLVLASSRDRVTVMAALGHLEAVGLVLVVARANRAGVPRWHSTNYALAVPTFEILTALQALGAAPDMNTEAVRDWFTPGTKN